MKKCSLIIVAGLVWTLLIPVQSAYAHVLIRDTSGSKGAILHIVPDDDPIAGKKATLFFDMQNDNKDINTVNLDITQQGSNDTVTVKTTLNGSLATADYTFPSQGVYFLKYHVISGDGAYAFEQFTRISRGIIIGSVDKPRRTWAEGLLAACSIIFAMLLIVAFNRRHAIAEQSTF
jgi:methionine-rich copper-binding protein CopC